MKLKTKKWILPLALLSLIVMLLWVSGVFLKCPVEIKSENFVYEYGEKVSTDLEAYFKVLDKERIDEVQFNLELPNEENISIGEYVGNLKWRNKTIEFTVVVKDTVAPEIKLKLEKVGIDYGESFNPIDNIVYVRDIIDGDVKYEVEGNVNPEKAGDYTIKVVTADKNGNATEKTFIVNVAEKPSSKTGHMISNNTNYPLIHEDETSKITITKEWYGSAWNYIAHLEFKDYSRFGTAVGNGKYGGMETTSHAAKRLEAILTVNGDYSAPYLNYPVARGGKVYNNKSAILPAVYSNKSGKLMSAWESGGTPGITGYSLSSLVANGKVSDTFCFGPPILSGGSVLGSNGGGRAQRTSIGTNGKAGDIWITVSEGRYVDGISAGNTFAESAKLLKMKGCTFGIPIDGGGSSTMVFKGKVLNHLQGGAERKIVDFMYFK